MNNIAQEDAAVQFGEWTPRWYGSAPYKGWTIMQGREEVASLGDDPEMSNEIHRLCAAHNSARAPAPALRIDFKQATELLAMFGGEPGEVTLLTGEGHSGRGLYAHYSEYPEEGAEFLGNADGEAAPTPAASAWRDIATAPKHGGEFLAVYGRQGNVMQIIRWNALHRFWQSKGEPEMGFTSNATGWHPLPAAPKHPSPQSEEGSLFLGVADGDAVGGKSGGDA